MSNRNVILYIAMSLDGYIAGKDDNLDFLSIVEKEGEDYGYKQFTDTIDTVIMGRKTYDKVCSFGIPFPHSDKQTFIITRSEKPAIGNITFYNKNVEELVLKLKSTHGKHIFVDGGAEIAHLLMNHNLIDEWVISVIPIILGEGITLFRSLHSEIKLKLINFKSFETGLVQLHYVKN